jgi:gamma-glutamylcyclotransferase (GGCT)/AIG2-like uncharacterized protein YtfP
MRSLIFVYGTLRSGSAHRAARRLHQRGEFLGSAIVHARLQRYGRWTAITRGDGKVRGEVYRVSPQLLRYLDAYEGSDYGREQVILHGHPARRAFAWFLRNTEPPL